MFIISIDGYNVPIDINHIHYIHSHFNITSQCRYCHFTYPDVEHYILDLSTKDKTGELSDINTKIGIHYKDNQITYVPHFFTCQIVKDKISDINQKMFIRLRKEFLYRNKFKCIWIKPYFMHINLVDVYYYILKMIIKMNDIEFLKPNTKIYIN